MANFFTFVGVLAFCALTSGAIINPSMRKAGLCSECSSFVNKVAQHISNSADLASSIHTECQNFGVSANCESMADSILSHSASDVETAFTSGKALTMCHDYCSAESRSERPEFRILQETSNLALSYVWFVSGYSQCSTTSGCGKGLQTAIISCRDVAEDRVLTSDQASQRCGPAPASLASSKDCVDDSKCCAPGCLSSMISDGVCDTACANPQCMWDKGDCKPLRYVDPTAKLDKSRNCHYESVASGALQLLELIDPLKVVNNIPHGKEGILFPYNPAVTGIQRLLTVTPEKHFAIAKTGPWQISATVTGVFGGTEDDNDAMVVFSDGTANFAFMKHDVQDTTMGAFVRWTTGSMAAPEIVQGPGWLDAQVVNTGIFRAELRSLNGAITINAWNGDDFASYTWGASTIDANSLTVSVAREDGSETTQVDGLTITYSCISDTTTVRLTASQQGTTSSAYGEVKVSLTAGDEMLLVELRLWGMTATKAHFHDGCLGSTGSVFDSGLPFLGLDTTTTAPQYIPVSAAQLVRLRAGCVYINAHSLAWPNGEIRGQVSPYLPAARSEVFIGASAANPGGIWQAQGYASVVGTVGQVMTFKYDASHDVSILANGAAFGSCDFTGATLVGAQNRGGGSAALPNLLRHRFTEAGTYYVASSVGTDCTLGPQKMIISIFPYVSAGAYGVWSASQAPYAAQTALAGDNMLFDFAETDNVYLLKDLAAFTACDFTGATLLASSTVGGGVGANPNKLFYKMAEPGRFYFASNATAGRCAAGVKLMMTVGSCCEEEFYEAVAPTRFNALYGSVMAPYYFINVPRFLGFNKDVLFEYDLAKTSIKKRSFMVEAVFAIQALTTDSEPEIVLTDGTNHYIYARGDASKSVLGKFQANTGVYGAWTVGSATPAGLAATAMHTRTTWSLVGTELTVSVWNGPYQFSHTFTGAELDSSKLVLQVRRDGTTESYNVRRLRVSIVYLQSAYWVAGTYGPCSGCNGIQNRQLQCQQEIDLVPTTVRGTCSGVVLPAARACSVDALSHKANFHKLVADIYHANGKETVTLFTNNRTAAMMVSVPKGPVEIVGNVYNKDGGVVYKVDRYLESLVTPSQAYFGVVDKADKCDTKSKGVGYAAITQSRVHPEDYPTYHEHPYDWQYHNEDYAWQSVQRWTWSTTNDKSKAGM